MKFAIISSAAIAIALSTPAYAATNLITNGSFESGFSDWSLAGSTGETPPVVIPYNNPVGYPNGAFGEAIPPSNAVSLSPDAVGDHAAYFSSDTGNDLLTQTVLLTNGVKYNVGFDYYAPQNGINNPYDALLSLLINGQQVGSSLEAGSPSGTPAQTWLNFNTSFVATGSGPFQFQFQGLGTTAADFAIDRVYLIAAAVPEPATWAMMILGIGMIGGVMRRRARTSVAYNFA